MRTTNNIDSEIGRILRQARLAKNLTQDGLAKRIGISFQQVQKYENGTNRVSASKIWAISSALDVPVIYFFEELEQTDISGKFDGGNTLPDSTIRVARMLNKMPDGNVKDQIFKLIKAFVKTSKN